MALHTEPFHPTTDMPTASLYSHTENPKWGLSDLCDALLSPDHDRGGHSSTVHVSNVQSVASEKSKSLSSLAIWAHDVYYGLSAIRKTAALLSRLAQGWACQWPLLAQVLHLSKTSSVIVTQAPVSSPCGTPLLARQLPRPDPERGDRFTLTFPETSALWEGGSAAAERSQTVSLWLNEEI
ncbi:hypothetical protein BX600DRAFT_432706 [Xylariales sp. PMI_506]|nr:hypothetical protein BX600DRAFT_432706 [Xylariales sp. PMI_506]